MTISIIIEPVNKMRAAFAFTWAGTDEDIADVMHFIESEADRYGITPEDLGRRALNHLVKFRGDLARQKDQMLLAIDCMLRMKIPELNAFVYDVAAQQDIVITVGIQNGKITAELCGRPRAN